MRNWHNSLWPVIFLLCSTSHADDGKIVASYGYFSINSTSSESSVSVSNPSAFHLGYLKPKWNNWELKIGYSLLLADFSGSDLGYGLDAGANYYPMSDSGEETLNNHLVSAHRYEILKPFIGMSFNQRSFQSIRNSYAGLGLCAGAERYFNESINLRAELRYVALSGSNESKASEASVLLGVVFKL
jgi:opacity protein-like surface antigen